MSNLETQSGFHLKWAISRRLKRLKRVTKLITSLKSKPYKERLMQLKLRTFKFRCMRGDMIKVFQLTHNIQGSPIKKQSPRKNAVFQP